MDDLSAKSTPDLVREVVSDLTTLVAKEIELAKVQITEGFAAKLKGAGLLAIALVAMLPGVLFLLVALALALPMSAAVGFTVVGGGMFVLAALFVAVGIALLKRKRGPKVAIGRIKEDAKWAREQLTS